MVLLCSGFPASSQAHLQRRHRVSDGEMGHNVTAIQMRVFLFIEASLRALFCGRERSQSDSRNRNAGC